MALGTPEERWHKIDKRIDTVQCSRMTFQHALCSVCRTPSNIIPLPRQAWSQEARQPGEHIQQLFQPVLRRDGQRQLAEREQRFVRAPRQCGEWAEDAGWRGRWERLVG